MKKRVVYIIVSLLCLLGATNNVSAFYQHEAVKQTALQFNQHKTEASSNVLVQTPYNIAQLDFTDLEIDDDDFQNSNSSFVFLAAAAVYLGIAFQYFGAAKQNAPPFITQVAPIRLHILHRNFRI